MEPKTWTEQEIIALMLETVTTVRQQCHDLNQAFKWDDAVEQIYRDLDNNGLIEHTP